MGVSKLQLRRSIQPNPCYCKYSFTGTFVAYSFTRYLRLPLCCDSSVASLSQRQAGLGHLLAGLSQRKPANPPLEGWNIMGIICSFKFYGILYEIISNWPNPRSPPSGTSSESPPLLFIYSGSLPFYESAQPTRFFLKNHHVVQTFTWNSINVVVPYKFRNCLGTQH